LLQAAELMFFVEAWCRLHAMRSKIKKSNATQLREMLRAKHISTATIDSSVDLQRAWLMVNRAARTQDWSTMCLPRSLVLTDMLRNRGHNAILRIGVNKSRSTATPKLFAHAWVEVDEYIVGEKATVENRFLKLI
jgi:hypothetical protein